MIAWPGAARITLVLLVVVPAAMAYPWRSARELWVLGVAVVVAIALLAWWRGRHVTAILRSRLAMARRNRGGRPMSVSRTDARMTVLVRVEATAAVADELPLPLIAGYLDRYGVRVDAVRVTSHDSAPEAGTPQRQTWIGLTLSAAANLAALRARSARIPLQQTAEVAARRLVDHLRETGWTATMAEPEDIAAVLEPSAPETWSGVRQGGTDYVAAYRVSIDAELSDTLAEIWSNPAWETWTALEIAGTATRRTLAVACAFRTDAPPGATPPCARLTAQHGNHRPALRALDPVSTQRLDGHTGPHGDLLAALAWPSAQPPVTVSAAAPPRKRHAATVRA
jgi:type VII secretion protein EccE